MSSETTNHNKAIEDLLHYLSIAKEKGVEIAHAVEGEIVSCVSMTENINEVIDLSQLNASTKLKRLTATIQSAITL